MENFFKYLTIGPYEEKWGLYLTTVGYSRIAPNQNYPINEEHPQSHSFNWDRGRILNGYYIIFISKGQGVFETARTQPATISEGTCLFLFPGVWHRYRPEMKTGWEEYWIGFNGTYAEELMTKGFFSPDAPNLTVGLNRDILSLFHAILDKVRNSYSGYPQVIAGITLQILGILNSISLYKEQENDPTSRLIAKAKFLIQESLEKPIDMEELVKELPMSYSNFRKAFKKYTGESPYQYHLNLRLDRAKDLLLSTTLNINEVAYQTGFDSVFYFSKLFKKKNGVAPKFYRSGNNEADER
jgi:AraC-like DNA-binding protein